MPREQEPPEIEEKLPWSFFLNGKMHFIRTGSNCVYLGDKWCDIELNLLKKRWISSYITNCFGTILVWINNTGVCHCSQEVPQTSGICRRQVCLLIPSLPQNGVDQGGGGGGFWRRFWDPRTFRVDLSGQDLSSQGRDFCRQDSCHIYKVTYTAQISYSLEFDVSLWNTIQQILLQERHSLRLLKVYQWLELNCQKH